MAPGADIRIRDAVSTEFTTIAEVASALEVVEAICLPRGDRRGVFATAYLQITRAIGTEIAAGRFHDADWTTRYLISFGNLYRRALLASETGGSLPKSWRIAFDAARDGTGFVIQHLLLGINAHINHDLALALHETGIDPERRWRYEDHTLINAVLEAATPQLKSEVSTKYAPILERLDWIAGRLDDALVAFSIPKARDHAWSFAVAIEGAKLDSERTLLRRALDEQAGVLAQLILAPPTRNPVLLKTVKVAGQVDTAFRKVTGLFGKLLGK
jgi:hypothetical protein